MTGETVRIPRVTCAHPYDQKFVEDWTNAPRYGFNRFGFNPLGSVGWVDLRNLAAHIGNTLENPPRIIGTTPRRFCIDRASSRIIFESLEVLFCLKPRDSWKSVS